MKNIVSILGVFMLTYFSISSVIFAQESLLPLDDLEINEYCIGKVCIGDSLKTVKENLSDYILKINDSQTGYYVFDETGNFLLEFSTKRELDDEMAPIRYIMTSNPIYTFYKDDISVDLKISELIDKYGEPEYLGGPNGYIVSFDKWPVKETSVHDKYSINLIVGVYNPGLADLFKYTGTMNEKAELQLLKNYPESTIISTIEIYSDYYKNGKPIQ
jgi:hypothetical protein